jgi:hypothetical protein
MIPLLAAGFFLAACDSGDPIDGPVPADVAGTYRFAFLTFEPDAPALPAYNVLDTLDLAQSQLQLLDGGSFVLTYRLEGANTVAVAGDFSVTNREVRLRGRETDQSRFDALLLDRNLTLQRSAEAPALLSAERRMTVDLAERSDVYMGIPPVAGTLRVRFER